jgi:hypothetical protein
MRKEDAARVGPRERSYHVALNIIIIVIIKRERQRSTL